MPSATTRKPPEPTPAPASDTLGLAYAVMDAADSLERARVRGDWLLVYEALERLKLAHAFIPCPPPVPPETADARP